MRLSYLKTCTKVAANYRWSIVRLWTEIAGRRCPIRYELRRNPSRQTRLKDDTQCFMSTFTVTFTSIKQPLSVASGWVRHLHIWRIWRLIVLTYHATNRTRKGSPSCHLFLTTIHPDAGVTKFSCSVNNDTKRTGTAAFESQ